MLQIWGLTVKLEKFVFIFYDDKSPAFAGSKNFSSNKFSSSLVGSNLKTLLCFELFGVYFFRFTDHHVPCRRVPHATSISPSYIHFSTKTSNVAASPIFTSTANSRPIRLSKYLGANPNPGRIRRMSCADIRCPFLNY